jgi:hypothetical protein
MTTRSAIDAALVQLDRVAKAVESDGDVAASDLLDWRSPDSDRGCGPDAAVGAWTTALAGPEVGSGGYRPAR